MTERKYNNVTFPQALLDEVDKIVKDKSAGYRSRNEFCVDAVRRLVWRCRQILGGDDGGGSD